MTTEANTTEPYWAMHYYSLWTSRTADGELFTIRRWDNHDPVGGTFSVDEAKAAQIVLDSLNEHDTFEYGTKVCVKCSGLMPVDAPDICRYCYATGGGMQTGKLDAAMNLAAVMLDGTYHGFVSTGGHCMVGQMSLPASTVLDTSKDQYTTEALANGAVIKDPEVWVVFTPGSDEPYTDPNGPNDIFNWGDAVVLSLNARVESDDYRYDAHLAAYADSEGGFNIDTTNLIEVAETQGNTTAVQELAADIIEVCTRMLRADVEAY